MKFNMRGIIIYPATIITRNRILFVLIMCLSYGSFFTGNAQATGKAPNIILIYADDLGYSDIGCYGREYGADFFETPNIDRLSSESVRFTNAYAAAPLCSPSRAALLTGKTPARLNFEFVTTNPGEKFNWDDSAWTGRFKKRKLIPPPHTLNLPLEEETIAELLKMQGYSTAMVGKWHVSSHYKVYNGWNPEFGPSKQGFDWTGNTFGAWGSAARKARGITIDGKLPADALTDTAISFLHEKHEKPFFLFVSHYYVHDRSGSKPTGGNQSAKQQLSPCICRADPCERCPNNNCLPGECAHFISCGAMGNSLPARWAVAYNRKSRSYAYCYHNRYRRQPDYRNSIR